MTEDVRSVTRRMLTKTDLGLMEQLGSQMSQYCVLETLARDTGHEHVFFERHLTRGVGTRRLFEAFDIPNRIVPGAPLFAPGVLRKVPWVANRSFVLFRADDRVAFDERLTRLCPATNYDLTGNFGLYEHWRKREAEHLRVFRFKPAVRERALHNMQEIRARCGGRAVVSVHVRRADYLVSPVHLNLSVRYYEEALSRFPADTAAVLVFSDDIAWCEAQPVFTRRGAHFSRGNPCLVDMCMMSLCDHHVIANSSFSFWGAMLGVNPARQVVCPRDFVQPGGHNAWINGRWYPPRWTALEAA